MLKATFFSALTIIGFMALAWCIEVFVTSAPVWLTAILSLAILATIVFFAIKTVSNLMNGVN